MGRNKKEGDLKLDIREKNGKFYAYRSTSTSVNGVKKTETEYLGRYDPETQTVIEKRIRGPRRSKEEIEATKKEMTIIDLLKGVESSANHILRFSGVSSPIVRQSRSL